MTKGWRSRAIGHVRVVTFRRQGFDYLLTLSCGHVARLAVAGLLARRGKNAIGGSWGTCRPCVSDALRNDSGPTTPRTALHT